jgi:hypothetical protein
MVNGDIQQYHAQWTDAVQALTDVLRHLTGAPSLQLPTCLDASGEFPPTDRQALPRTSPFECNSVTICQSKSESISAVLMSELLTLMQLLHCFWVSILCMMCWQTKCIFRFLMTTVAIIKQNSVLVCNCLYCEMATREQNLQDVLRSPCSAMFHYVHWTSCLLVHHHS